MELMGFEGWKVIIPLFIAIVFLDLFDRFNRWASEKFGFKEKKQNF